MKIKMLTQLCILTLCITSCAPLTPQMQFETTPQTFTKEPPDQENVWSDDKDKCIPPVTEFEFPARQERTASDTKDPVIPLPSEWEIQTSLPEKSQEATLELIERHPGYNVIWIKAHIDSWFNPGGKFFLYRTDTQQWDSVSYGLDDDKIPSHLFQDQNGEVWGLQLTSVENLPLLLHFDSNGKFESVSDAENDLTTDWESAAPPLVDSDGTFWLLLINDKQNTSALFSFDPYTKKSKSHIAGTEMEFARSIALGQDGSIFLLRFAAGELVQYFPSTGTSRTIGLKDRIEGDGDAHFRTAELLLDRSGRLWIDDYGWLDTTVEDYPTWHQIIRSPLFISKTIVFYSYFWLRPNPALQSSDGRIWYTLPSLTWLDPDEGKWCKITTLFVNTILEDQKGDLWVLYNNDLYKYTILP